MTSTASVCGLYFAHADAAYFNLGALGRDQVADYARRKGVPLAEAERWLAPNLAYESEAPAASKGELGGEGVADGQAVVREG